MRQPRLEIAGYGSVHIGVQDDEFPEVDSAVYVGIFGDEDFIEGLAEGDLLLTVDESRALRKRLKKTEKKVARIVEDRHNW